MSMCGPHDSCQLNPLITAEGRGQVPPFAGSEGSTLSLLNLTAVR